MDDLQNKIFELIKKTVPDINEEKARDLAIYLTSEDVGVRSLERLYDLPQSVISLKVPVCDAVRLHRSWQAKFRPDVLPQLINQPPSAYRIKWNHVPKTILNQLEAGQWLSKVDRCMLIRLIVRDVMTENPNVSRRMFRQVAETMVAKYPHALHDRNKKLTDCNYLDQKLKFRFDEEMRAHRVKNSNEAPNIPEAHGCVRWRVTVTPAERDEMLQKKETMAQIFNTTLAKDWPWDDINKNLVETYPLQREDINSQVKKKSRRARGAGHEGQEINDENRKTTQVLTAEWPFLFQSKGMVLHFNELTQINWMERLSEFKEKFETKSFIKFMSTLRELENSSTRKRFKRAVKHNTCHDPDLLAIVLMLAEYYNEKKEEILIKIESTTKINEVKDIDGLELPATPCLLSLGPAFKARKFYFAVDSNVVSSVKNFKQGLSLLFCSYFVLNIKYAANAGNTLDFLQRVVAKIEPDRGTKRQKQNYKQPLSERLQTLLDKHATWVKQQQQHQEDPDAEGDNLF